MVSGKLSLERYSKRAGFSNFVTLKDEEVDNLCEVERELLLVVG